MLHKSAIVYYIIHLTKEIKKYNTWNAFDLHKPESYLAQLVQAGLLFLGYRRNTKLCPGVSFSESTSVHIWNTYKL